jgi:2-polyprenyl-3-methyl-5-hydroxy-6-metoxy-1,4-benzoquinol methylase
MEDARCPSGCAAGDRHVFEGRDRLQGLPGRFRVVQCEACGLMRTNPRPTPASMSLYYGDSYPPYTTSQKRTGWSADLVDRLLLAEAVPALPPGRMLEFGCASGGFLDRMSRRGWEVEGIEFSEQAARRARSLGFRVHAGRLETTPSAPATFDLVTGWMVLEHLHDPIAGLRKLQSWTRPGGWLAISVPNAGGLQRRLFKDAWFPLQVPNHLFHFTPRTLTAVLQRGGWSVQRIFCHPNLSDVVASVGYLLDDRQLSPALARLLVSYPWRGGRLNLGLLPLAYPLGVLGQTGRMTAWARKEEAA